MVSRWHAAGGRRAAAALAALLLGCAGAQKAPPPARGPVGFEEWVLDRLGEDAAAWDRLPQLLEPLRRRLAYDLGSGEVLLLDRELPEAAALPYAAQGDKGEMTTLHAEGEAPRRMVPYASSGGLWNVLHPMLPGHYDISRKVLGEDGQPWRFNDQAAEVVADASRDPDLFAWLVPAAHAQTPNHPRSLLPLSPETAPRCFHAWVRGRLESARRACEGADLRLALYHLGLSLHAVQDLATHRGITNAEHSFLSHCGFDPDREAERLELAETLSRDFLEHVVAAALGSCYERLRHAEGASVRPLGVVELMARHGYRLQLTRSTYKDYKRMGPEMAGRAGGCPKQAGGVLDALPAAMHVEWFSGGRWLPVMEALHDGVLGEEAPSWQGCAE